MTLYKIVGPSGEVIATLSCGELKLIEGKNCFEVIGLAAQPVGVLTLTSRNSVEIVGGIVTKGDTVKRSPK